MRPWVWLLVAVVASVSLSGCFSGDEQPEDDTAPEGDSLGRSLPTVDANFTEHTINVAVFQGLGLYEPTIDVGSDGNIYVSAHSTGIGVLPAPAYVSTDDGASWLNMATVGSVQNPGPGQTASPPFSDELFIVAGAEGEAWGVDINLRDYIVTGWCEDGADNCYYNPNAYDHTATVTQATDCVTSPLKDRPWVAYANGKLLLVNNGGDSPAQIAAMDVPPAAPAGIAHVTDGIQWNLCASSGGWIPGIPDLRDDGFFAVPQRQPSGTCDDEQYILVTGNVADVHAVEEQVVMKNSDAAAAETDGGNSGIGPFGQAVFDAHGTLFVGTMNNTSSECSLDIRGNPDRVIGEAGGIHLVASTDDGRTFKETFLRFPTGVSSIYMDGNKNGRGALLNWGQIDGANTDWYMGHVVLDDKGAPQLQNVMLAVNDGPEASGDIQGAALGPDGRAYMVMSYISSALELEGGSLAVGSTPLRVVVQVDGPLL